MTCEENGETLSLALAGGYDKDMEPNPYLTPQTADALKRKRRRIDLFDVFAYGLCGVVRTPHSGVWRDNALLHDGLRLR